MPLPSPLNRAPERRRIHPPSPGRRTACLAAAVLLVCCAFTARAQDVTLNLKDADISALINTIAEVTGKNFVVDPRVKGKVTVISAQPMDHTQLYQVFLSILEVHGFAAVPAGEVIKIIPTAGAKTSGAPVVTPRTNNTVSGDIVTEVIPIKNVPAAQLVPILRPLVPQFGHLAAAPGTNVLIISDRAANVRRLQQIISRIDVPSGQEAEVVALRNASADEVVRLLNSLSGEQGGIKAVADLRTNSILLGGNPTERLRLRGLIAHLDTPQSSNTGTQVIYLRNGNAEAMAPLLMEVTGEQTGAAGKQPGGGKISIQADPATNALILTAPPDTLSGLRQIIRQLDIRRAQVLVEAIIAEVSDDKARELGVQWFIDGSADGTGPVGATSFGGTGSNIVDLVSGVLQGAPVVGRGTSLAVGRFNSGNRTNIAGLLRLLVSDSQTNVLSTPSLMTLDNEEAEIIVGQSVPFITGQFTNTGASQSSVNPFQTIQREDVGLKLKVKPHISEGNHIRLELEQEVSSISAASGSASVAASDIITNKRSIRTTVLAEDRQTVVLGGLIDDNTTEVVEKVPLLGSIPVVGRLFRHTTTNKTKRNLMVFLRPLIVRDAAASSLVTGGKYEALRQTQISHRDAPRDAAGSGALPVLPPLEAYRQQLDGQSANKPDGG